MLPLYAKISRDITHERRQKLMRSLFCCILDQVQKSLKTNFSVSGIQQFFLDIHLLLLVSNSFLDEQATERGTEICEHAMRMFKQTNTVQFEMPDASFFDQKAHLFQSRLQPDFGN